MYVKPQFELKSISGLNNVNDPSRISAGELTKAINVDIDDRGTVMRRGGYTKIMSGNYHSIFIHNQTIFAVKIDSFVMIDARSYVENILLSGLSVGSRMSYAVANDRVYYTNGVIIGYVDNGVRYDIPATDIQYKQKIPPGQIIRFYKGRLYVASGQTLFYSDAMALDRYTISPDGQNFKQFDGVITMLAPVVDGIYISDGVSTFFMAGVSPEDTIITLVDSAAALKNTSVSVLRGNIRNGEPIQKPIAMWMSTKGVCLGADSGFMLNLTQKKYKHQVMFPESCNAFYRETNKTNIPQYIYTEKN